MTKLANILLILGWIGLLIQITNPFHLENRMIYPMIIVPIFMLSIIVRYIKPKPKSKYETRSTYERNKRDKYTR